MRSIFSLTSNRRSARVTVTPGCLDRPMGIHTRVPAPLAPAEATRSGGEMSAVVMVQPSQFTRADRSRPALGTRRPVHRPAPRSNRTAAVYRRRRFAAAAVGIGAVLAVGHAGVALGGTSLATPDARP